MNGQNATANPSSGTVQFGMIRMTRAALALAVFASVAVGRLSAFSEPPPGDLAVKPKETPVVADKAAPRDVSDLLAPIIAKHEIPAMAACVVQDGRVVMLGVSGVRQRGSPDLATTSDLWHLGSCTKAMTATLCGQLVEQGKLTWESTIGEVFPDLKEQAEKNGWAGVTLGQLCTNSSSVPGDLGTDGLWSKLWQHKGTNTAARRVLLEGVLGYTPAQAPGTKYEYSNAGFAIAGHMCEQVTGRAWEELITAELFTPLGITSAGFGAPGVGEEKGTVTQPRGHAGKGKAGKPIAPGPKADNPAAIGPAGTAHMTITDWARFAALHAAEARPDASVPEGVKRDIVSAATFARLHTAPTTLKTNYAYGWIASTRPWAKGTREGDTGRVLTHSGSNTMWFCTAWVAPERNLAIVVACNQGDGGKAADEAVGAIIKALRN